MRNIALCADGNEENVLNQSETGIIMWWLRRSNVTFNIFETVA